jgi:c-di-GMP-binding flagellar brake protein YcgR
MPVAGVDVAIGEHRGELLNLSVSGALFTIDAELAVGTERTMSFRAGDHVLTLTARVTWISRERASAPAGTQVRYTAGVAFLDQSGRAQRTIQQFYVHGVRGQR